MFVIVDGARCAECGRSVVSVEWPDGHGAVLLPCGHRARAVPSTEAVRLPVR